jgi:hypothetical protein
VSLVVPASQLVSADAAGRSAPMRGALDVAVGGKQPGMKGRADAATTGVATGRVGIQ